jgi:nucleotide-binding universal stress UspA family protein
VSTSHSQGTLARIAAGVDLYPEGRDAAALGASLARVLDAELMLVAVHSNPMIVLPSEVSWSGMHEAAQTQIRELRDAVAPDARIVVETDWSVPRALLRVAEREHRDLLVVGSSRHAPDGGVRIGKRTRQLLDSYQCALAIAPRGYNQRPEAGFDRIGVGYDGEPESRAALALAGSIALAAGAQLHARAVVDDRIPPIGWPALARGGALHPVWEESIQATMDSLRQELLPAAQATGAAVQTEVLRGRPADALLALSREVDLLVIGSRRWGPLARVLLGGTGETLLHEAHCPMLVVPRPPT